MKIAEDFRRIARSALAGRWVTAVIAGLVATLLGGSFANGVKFNIDLPSRNINIDFSGKTVFSSSASGIIFGGVAYILIVALVIIALYMIIGSLVEVGYAKFNLNLIDRKEVFVGTLFEYVNYWKTAVAVRFLKSLYIILWSMLFVIPGIIATYSYSMTGYILAEKPEMSASEAIAESKEMMRGNRFRLFCLHLSFIGWALLSAVTMEIGRLWLNPYINAATAAFYREITGTEIIDFTEPR